MRREVNQTYLVRDKQRLNELDTRLFSLPTRFYRYRVNDKHIPNHLQRKYVPDQYTMR